MAGAESRMSRAIATRRSVTGLPSSSPSTRANARPIRYATSSSIWSGQMPRTSYALKIEGSTTPGVLQEAAAAEVRQHPGEGDRHHDDDRPERPDPAVERELHVHPEEAGEEGERQDHDAERREHLQHLVHTVRDHRLVRVLERLHDLLVVL